MDNQNNELLLFIYSGRDNFLIPPKPLRALACTCKYFYTLTYESLQRIKFLRAMWEPRLATAYHRHLLAKLHPIMYTGTHEYEVPINGEMGANERGICILDTNVNIFPIPHMKFAFANVRFVTCEPVRFYAILYVRDCAIAKCKIAESDYVYIPGAEPRYLVNLHLPTQYNPVIIDLSIVHAHHIAIGVGTKMKETEDIFYVDFDLEFVMKYFVSAIVSFKTVESQKYNWDKYNFTFNGHMNYV